MTTFADFRFHAHDRADLRDVDGPRDCFDDDVGDAPVQGLTAFGFWAQYHPKDRTWSILDSNHEHVAKTRDEAIAVLWKVAVGLGFDPAEANRCDVCEAARTPYVAPDTRLETIVDRAEEAFWAVVADGYPEVLTGDFGPSESHHLTETLRSAVRLWLDYNLPACELRDDCPASCARIRAASCDRCGRMVLS